MVAALALGSVGCAIEADEVILEEEQYASYSVSGETIVRWNQNAVTIANGPALPMMRELAIDTLRCTMRRTPSIDVTRRSAHIARDRRADPVLAAAAAAHDALAALKPARVVEIEQYEN